jgi:hypothetical protein
MGGDHQDFEEDLLEVEDDNSRSKPWDTLPEMDIILCNEYVI